MPARLMAREPSTTIFRCSVTRQRAPVGSAPLHLTDDGSGTSTLTTSRDDLPISSRTLSFESLAQGSTMLLGIVEVDAVSSS